MSFALGLGILGAGVATGVQSYLRTVAQQERNLRDRIALESAGAITLGRLAAGSQGVREATVAVAGRTLIVETTPTTAKWDLVVDNPEALRAALRAMRLPALPPDAVGTGGLPELSGALSLTASQEDCLRRGFTFGRGGQPRSEGAAPDRFAATAGDQFDLRIHDRAAPDRVLWLRARMTGGATGWMLHDYRLLRGASGCETAR